MRTNGNREITLYTVKHIGKVQVSNFTQQRGFDWRGSIDSEFIFTRLQFQLLFMPTIIGSVSFARFLVARRGNCFP